MVYIDKMRQRSTAISILSAIRLHTVISMITFIMLYSIVTDQNAYGFKSLPSSNRPSISQPQRSVPQTSLVGQQHAQRPSNPTNSTNSNQTTAHLQSDAKQFLGFTPDLLSKANRDQLSELNQSIAIIKQKYDALDKALQTEHHYASNRTSPLSAPHWS